MIRSILQLTIADLSRKRPYSAIVGSRSAKQAEGVMKAGELKLTDQDLAQIEGKAAAMAVR